MTNCFTADSLFVSPFIKIATKGDYHHVVGIAPLAVFKEVGIVDGAISSATVWPTVIHGHERIAFGVRNDEEQTLYVMVDTGGIGKFVQGVTPFVGEPKELGRGRTEDGRKFVFAMKAGDEIAYTCANGVVRKVVATAEGLRFVDVDLRSAESITQAIKLAEGLTLASLTSDAAKTAQQAGFQVLISLFEGRGADGGIDAFKTLLTAEKLGTLGPKALVRYEEIVRPKMGELLKAHGHNIWSMNGEKTSEYMGQVTYVFLGISRTFHTSGQRPKKTLADERARKAARQERDRQALSAKGTGGGKKKVA